MAEKGSIVASLLGSVLVSGVVSGLVTLYGSRNLEKYKLDLQNKNIVFSKKLNTYSSFNDKLRLFGLSLDKYVRLCELGITNPHDKALQLAAKQTMNETSDLMGDVSEAAFNGIDEETRNSVDLILTPVSLNLRDVQNDPMKNPKLVKLYYEQLKQALENTTKEIDIKISSFQL